MDSSTYSQSSKIVGQFAKIKLADKILSTNSSGNLTLDNLEINGGVSSTAGSFETLYVNGGATVGQLSVGTEEGIAASINWSGDIDSRSIRFLYMYAPLGTVTQTTSIITPVSGATQFGNIITVSTTLVTQGSVQFTVNNPYVGEGIRVISSITKYNGLGIPHVHVSDIRSSEFDIVLSNVSTVDSLNSVVEIGYIVLGNE